VSLPYEACMRLIAELRPRADHQPGFAELRPRADHQPGLSDARRAKLRQRALALELLELPLSAETPSGTSIRLI
jgi:hypothetical protein